ncbi:MAG TPA: serine/threonine-protein kinase, partial [Myxococcales bacterium]
MASPQPPAADSKEREQTAGARQSSAFTPGGTSTLSGEPHAAAPAREPPFTLSGRYVVERQLGAGGMGRVYLARDLRMKRAVAVKLLSAQSATPEQLKRLEEEALVVGSLGHPNVVAVHDIGHDGDQPFIVQEFLEGSTLRELARRQPPSIEEAVRIATQIARGLGAAHEKEIVHCDLKPENVFVSTDGWVKILDFGVARLSAGSQAGAAGAGDPSREGWFSGTVRYSSPEQIRGSVLDVRSDIFSFGVVLHELLTGHLPFEGSNSIQVGWSIVNRAPAELPSSVPHPIRAVVKRCLQKDRRNRFQTGKDL